MGAVRRHAPLFAANNGGCQAPSPRFRKRVSGMVSSSRLPEGATRSIVRNRRPALPEGSTAEQCNKWHSDHRQPHRPSRTRGKGRSLARAWLSFLSDEKGAWQRSGSAFKVVPPRARQAAGVPSARSQPPHPSNARPRRWCDAGLPPKSGADQKADDSGRHKSRTAPTCRFDSLSRIRDTNLGETDRQPRRPPPQHEPEPGAPRVAIAIARARARAREIEAENRCSMAHLRSIFIP
jgi:hypothetical protein